MLWIWGVAGRLGLGGRGLEAEGLGCERYGCNLLALLVLLFTKYPFRFGCSRRFLKRGPSTLFG